MNSIPQPKPLSASHIGRLLIQLNCAFDESVLARTVEHMACNFSSQRLAEWLRAVLARTNVAEVVPLVFPWRRFDLQLLPALVWHDEHWWVATASEGDHVTLLDEAGNATQFSIVSMQAALVVWFRLRAKAGRFRLFHNPTARLLWLEIFRDAGWVWKISLATIAINLLAIATSLFSMQVYDRVVPTLAYSTLTTMVAGMALVSVMDVVLKVSRARILDSLACWVDKRMSQHVFEHLLHLRLDIQPRSIGMLAAQITGLDTVRQFFSSAVIFGLVDVPFALFFLACIAVIGGQVAWVYALILPIALLVGWFTHQRLKQLVAKQVTRSNERQGVLVDAIRGAESIRATNTSWRFAQEWERITATIDAYNIQQKATHNLMSVGTGWLSTVAYVGAIVAGVWEVEAGHLSSGGMVACGLLGGRIISPIIQGVQYLGQWEQVSQALHMVDRVLSLELERDPEQTLLSPQLPVSGLTLQVDKLRYGYPDSPILQIQLSGSLTFRSGDRVLLLGAIGCGKSTLLKMLAGLYRPRDGGIRMAGIDLFEIDPGVLAGQVGYLPQDVHLFKGTLRSNLTGTGLVSDVELGDVVASLGIDKFSERSPQGMDRKIDEGGVGLSGGQRQMVGLARVMLSRPRLWLLDEPTASLDGENEARVWQTLARQIRPEDIVIISTHKPGKALGFFNRILLLKDGDIVQDGSPKSVFPQLFGTPDEKPKTGENSRVTSIERAHHAIQSPSP